MIFKITKHYTELDDFYKWLDSYQIQYSFPDTDILIRGLSQVKLTNMRDLLYVYAKYKTTDRTVTFHIDIPDKRHAMLFKLTHYGK